MRPHGDYIRLRRQALKMSLGTVSALTGINKGHLSRVERGLAGLGDDYTHLLAEVLDVPPIDITHDTPKEKT
ncbi:helix-turn-helix domain-containing protein [Streptomyces sp. NPDC058001]|uniref:helix-turn-helix domain-containing protein n=1 Tax=Streptomyces sp. NPDC058001 TaxID=3346300 RepID=UPI0036E87AB0